MCINIKYCTIRFVVGTQITQEKKTVVRASRARDASHRNAHDVVEPYEFIAKRHLIVSYVAVACIWIFLARNRIRYKRSFELISLCGRLELAHMHRQTALVSDGINSHFYILLLTCSCARGSKRSDTLPTVNEKTFAPKIKPNHQTKPIQIRNISGESLTTTVEIMINSKLKEQTADIFAFWIDTKIFCQRKSTGREKEGKRFEYQRKY